MVWSLVLGGIIAGGASLVLLTFAVAHKLPERWVPQAVRTGIASFHTGMLPRPPASLASWWSIGSRR